MPAGPHQSALLKLELPVTVRIAERTLSVREILDFAPGSVIDLDKPAEEDLDLLANGRVVAAGKAVKVGDHFGIRITRVGDSTGAIRPARKQESQT